MANLCGILSIKNHFPGGEKLLARHEIEVQKGAYCSNKAEKWCKIKSKRTKMGAKSMLYGMYLR